MPTFQDWIPGQATPTNNWPQPFIKIATYQVSLPEVLQTTAYCGCMEPKISLLSWARLTFFSEGEGKKRESGGSPWHSGMQVPDSANMLASSLFRTRNLIKMCAYGNPFSLFLYPPLQSPGFFQSDATSFFLPWSGWVPPLVGVSTWLWGEWPSQPTQCTISKPNSSNLYRLVQWLGSAFALI